tara:strand:+ start:276 stop:479 length:204 start_codon:yes stop_codon:yes gene_type:complete
VASRLYYRSKDGQIVLEQNGLTLMNYKSVNDLVESHIKGLLAIRSRDGIDTSELLSQYQSCSDSGRS